MDLALRLLRRARHLQAEEPPPSPGGLPRVPSASSREQGCPQMGTASSPGQDPRSPLPITRQETEPRPRALRTLAGLFSLSNTLSPRITHLSPFAVSFSYQQNRGGPGTYHPKTPTKNMLAVLSATLPPAARSPQPCLRRLLCCARPGSVSDTLRSSLPRSPSSVCPKLVGTPVLVHPAFAARHLRVSHLPATATPAPDPLNLPCGDCSSTAWVLASLSW